MKCTENFDLFDLTGADKLAADSVEARDALIREYANNDDIKCHFYLSDSAGKDSQFAKLKVLELVPHHKITVVHANLTSEVEHDGVIEHIEKFTPPAIPVEVVQNPYRNLIDGILLRGKFMGGIARFCTSDYKVQQIDKFIRKDMKARGIKVAFNVTGIRAAESKMRSMKNPLFINKRLTTKSRTVFDWMPIFDASEDATYDAIYASGQHPHPAYGERGEKYSRLSCAFCYMASKGDLKEGAKQYPDKYASYIAIERVLDHSMFFKKVNGAAVKVSLEERAGVQVDELLVEQYVKAHTARQKRLLEAKREADLAKEIAKKEREAAKNKVDKNQLVMAI
ncbi:phosphoadenosine phosphosulfate reductase [Alteromonas sp. DY56-G5]|jgi:3'-phosphoadenosine 5'-phosphosulfate sulfotransferase (PAPS reductase)/FAD synthetase|uniref:Phosphoadenosine phosphosulfate reductase n=1 Tax=Alteromonas mediterranea TaxID=314275 RepID=A0AAC8XNZ8_9ALTE|nr:MULTISPECIES: phosphoadenosine phosphosulfate reductase [Alteromonas]PTT96285.1 phosphoadenosine phosphosulfate reductase [Pseudomonas sp. HMWF031]AFV87607.1 phosphoadenosine phosphosulfate reductase [Alteromonas mediterranea DE1]AGP87644.1 phosphoadenosine phosphosulfate reductase [Alteromonas mediterranea U4]AGP99626.1 phosphoadenosine phosphosulfate reductase [Alteromonas mediterranea UM7]AMJ80733.1 hypothetical protein AV942_20330 [Alteromonas mediterranea]|tara:strand:- start:19 stop:1032 length:1014 start_codon:yes stop_codon:yes gene_type:complete